MVIRAVRLGAVCGAEVFRISWGMMLFKRKIIGALQSPVDDAPVNAIVRVEGWVLSRTDGRPDLTIMIDGRPVGAEVKWSPRPDVFDVHSTWAQNNHPTPGFLADLSTILLQPGRHILTVKAGHDGKHRVIAKRTFRVPECDAITEPAVAKPTLTTRNRVLFLHIPKTAGTSLNSYLSAHYKPAQVAMHVEHRTLGREWLREDFEDKLLITGHMKLGTLFELVDREKYFLITVLRDPRKQVMSQLAWHQRLAAPESTAERMRLKPVFIDMIERLSGEGPARFLHSLRGDERLMFDNVYTRRMLSLSGDESLPADATCDAIRRLSSFDLIGVTERMEEFLWLLSFYMAWLPARNLPRLNVAKSDHYAAIRANDAELMHAIDFVTRSDEQLYRHAHAAMDLQVKNMLRVLCCEFPKSSEALLAPATQNQTMLDLLQRRAVNAGYGKRC